MVNFNSVVYKILLKHPFLRTVHFKLTNLPVDVDERFSDEFMQNYELSCLNTLGRLQGLEKVTLEGFRFQDRAYIASIKRKMLEPRPQCWNALSQYSPIEIQSFSLTSGAGADYHQALPPLRPLQPERLV